MTSRFSFFVTGSRLMMTSASVTGMTRHPPAAGEGSMHDRISDTDKPLEAEDTPGTSPKTASRPEACADPLLEFLEEWEQFYRRGQDPPPGWPGAADAALRDALHERIQDQKRLYALLDLADAPVDGAAKNDESYPSFPDHEILVEIGRGGMGVVYKARERSLGRIVAIKTIGEGRRATPDQRARFRAEAEAIARLRHPNIIGIHAIREHARQPYLSLEFAEGGSLAERLAERPMAPRQAAELVETLAAPSKPRTTQASSTAT